MANIWKTEEKMRNKEKIWKQVKNRTTKKIIDIKCGHIIHGKPAVFCLSYLGLKNNLIQFFCYCTINKLYKLFWLHPTPVFHQKNKSLVWILPYFSSFYLSFLPFPSSFLSLLLNPYFQSYPESVCITFENFLFFLFLPLSIFDHIF